MTPILSPARPRALVTKCVVPPRAKTVPTIFFYFGARSRNNYPQIVRDLGMVHIEPFFRYGRERAAAATLTYYSNNEGCTYRGKCHSTIKYWVCFQNATKWQNWSSSAPLNEAITTNNVIKLYLIKRLSIKISATRTNRPKMDQKTPSEFMENLNPV